MGHNWVYGILPTREIIDSPNGALVFNTVARLRIHDSAAFDEVGTFLLPGSFR